VADTRAAGATVRLGADVTAGDRTGGEVVDARRGPPVPLPTGLAGALDVHLVGDASGTGGIAAALRAAADLAAAL
jgi:hypothetical protein